MDRLACTPHLRHWLLPLLLAALMMLAGACTSSSSGGGGDSDGGSTDGGDSSGDTGGDDSLEPVEFVISASVSGLRPGFGLVVTVNGTEVTLTQDVSAEALVILDDGTNYEVTLEPNPFQRCDGEGLTGSVDGSDITVTIACEFLVPFGGADSSNNFEPWLTDGTPEGTALAIDLNEGGGSYPGWFTFFNGYLYMRATVDGTVGLWRYDGEAAERVVMSGAELESPTSLTVFGDVLLFSASVDGDTAVMVYDGTSDPETLGGTGFFSDGFGILDGVAYFAGAGIDGETLFSYDGEVLTELAFYSSTFTPVGMTTFQDALYLAADGDDDADQELWRYVPGDGFEEVEDLWAGGDSFPRYLTPFAGDLYFRAIDDVSGSELFFMDHEDSDIAVAADIVPSTIGSDPNYLTVLGDALYFAASTSEDENKLFRYTPEGGAEVLPEVNESGSDYPSPDDTPRLRRFGVVNGVLVYGATNNGSQFDLYRYDPEADDVVPLTDADAAFSTYYGGPS